MASRFWGGGVTAESRMCAVVFECRALGFSYLCGGRSPSFSRPGVVSSSAQHVLISLLRHRIVVYTERGEKQAGKAARHGSQHISLGIWLISGLGLFSFSLASRTALISRRGGTTSDPRPRVQEHFRGSSAVRASRAVKRPK